MFRWIVNLFRSRPDSDRRAGHQATPPTATRGAPTDAAAQPAPRKKAERRRASLPTRARLSGHGPKDLAQRETEALSRIETRVRKGRLELPPLSSTAVAVVSMLNNRDVEVTDLVDTISTDPVLSSELLKNANSVLYGSLHVASIREAIARVGLRRLRSMVYASSMRGMIFGFDALNEHVEEVWRQAYMSAAIAQEIAPRLGVDGEKAFMIGLLHDIGRIPLLVMLNQEGRQLGNISENLIGRVFNRFHESAGEALARAWDLSDEVASVAGCHHRYETNEEYPHCAALAHLAHHLDLLLSLGSSDEELGECPEFDFFELDDERRTSLIESVRTLHHVIGEGEPLCV